MAQDSNARAAPRRVAGALQGNDNVDSVLGDKQDGQWDAWVVVRDRSWATEHPVFQAHVDVDPDFYLTVHVTDRPERVPPGRAARHR